MDLQYLRRQRLEQIHEVDHLKRLGDEFGKYVATLRKVFDNNGSVPYQRKVQYALRLKLDSEQTRFLCGFRKF